MADILYYRDLSDSYEKYTTDKPRTISAIFPDVTDWDKYRIITNNQFVTSDYVINENDKIIIRAVPFGISTAALTAIGLTLAAPFLIVGATAVGYEIYNARQESKRIREELERLNKAANDGVVNLPYIRGANNTKATGKTQPYFIGENLFTPYKLNCGSAGYEGFSTISGTDGETQLYNVVFECGFNKQVFRRIYCDDITIKNFTGNTPQEGVFNIETGSVFASNNSKIEIAQDGNAFTTERFNQKIIETKTSDIVNVYDAENPNEKRTLYYTLENNAMGVDVCILFNGLRHYTADGTPENKERTINVEYSVDYAHRVAQGDANAETNATWNMFYFTQGETQSNVFSRNETKQLRFNAHKDFTYSEIFNNGVKRYNTPVTIRVTTPDSKPVEGQDKADCYVNWIHSYCYDTNATKTAGAFVSEKIIGSREAALSTLLGLSIEATAANQDKLKSIQVITSGVARVWDGTKWGGTSGAERVPTSNPAAWLLEVMTSGAHAPSKTDDTEIDLASFGAWYSFCEQKNLTVNYVITNGMAKNAVYDLILECGRAALYPNIYGKIAVAIDKVNENCIGILNEQNIISLSYDKNIGRRVDGLRVTYIDAAADYQENSVIVMYDGSDPDDRSADAVLTSIRLDGTHTHDEAVRRAYYIMKRNVLRPKEIKIEVGEEGIFYTPYSKFGVSHPVIKTGKGNGEIKSVILNGARNQITGLELYDAVDLTENQNYTFIIQAVGDNYSKPIQLTVKGNAGRVYEVELLTPYSVTSAAIPHVGDVFAYGLNTETVIDEMLITGIEKSDNGYVLTLCDYDERVINDAEVIPDYTPDFSRPQKPLNNTINNGVTFEDLEESKAAAKDYTDREIAEVSLIASPQYQVIFNTPVIRKGNDGEYSPSNITATSYKTTNVQAEYSGVFTVTVNNTEYQTITGSQININVVDLLETFDTIDTVKIKFETSGSAPLQIAETVIPVISGASAYSVVLENPGQIYEADENGNVTEHTVKTRARVYYGLRELEYLAADGWEYGIIEAPAGFNISVNAATGEISINNTSGAAMAAYGRIIIPVFIHSQTNTEVWAGYEKTVGGTTVKMYSGYNDNFEGYLTPDENGYFNCFFTFQKLTEYAVKLATLNAKVNGYWNELTNDKVITVSEKETLRVIVNSITSEYTKYTSYYSKHNNYSDYALKYTALINTVLPVINLSGNTTMTESEKAAFNAVFENYYSSKTTLENEINATASNFTGINTVTKINDLAPKPGDYFVWTGDDETAITGVILRCGLVYTWNGDNWVEDNDPAHTMATMSETIAYVKSADILGANIPAVVMAKNMITCKLITEQVFANYVTTSVFTTKTGEISLTANTALSTANTADGNASTALSTATAAQTAASAAETAATNAATSAENAEQSATDSAAAAESSAGSASSAAESSETAAAEAGNAATSATNAEAAAESADTRATAAENKANAADQKAEQAKTAATSAETKAGEAKTAAAAKRRVFTTTPIVPYDKGDLWIKPETINVPVYNAETGETTTVSKTCEVIYYATKSKTASQSYAAADWDEGNNLQDAKLKDALVNGKVTAIGGYLNADLIDVDELMANDVTIRKTLKTAGITGINDTVNKGFFVDKDGNTRINNLKANNGEFNGIISQGIKYYFDTKIKVTFNADGSINSFMSSNPIYTVNDFARLRTGVFILRLPRNTPLRSNEALILPIFASDYRSNGNDYTYIYDLQNEPITNGGSNTKFQVNLCSGHVAIDSDLNSYLPIFVTSNTSNEYTTPVCMEFVLISIG